MATILIIEDDDQIRTMLQQVLDEEGYDVMEARDGREGTRMCREKSPDLVITDMVMPKKDGMETIVDLRMEFPDVKIIAISGGGRVGPETYLEIAKGFGAEAIFTKPFMIRELLDSIKRLLD